MLNNLNPKRTTLVDVEMRPNEETVIETTFDPLDADTYTTRVTTTIYDSLGASHTLSLYFVKTSEAVVMGAPSHWRLFVLVDDADVGDPNPEPPNNFVATQAEYDIYFDAAGNFFESDSDSILISNWVPLTENGQPNSADGPFSVTVGGTDDIDHERPTSSNFIVTLRTVGNSAAGDRGEQMPTVSQNGYATGRLTTGALDACGRVLLSYTNGWEFVVGQLPLAQFTTGDISTLPEEGVFSLDGSSLSPEYDVACGGEIANVTVTEASIMF